jgi:hypothetical protein
MTELIYYREWVNHTIPKNNIRNSIADIYKQESGGVQWLINKGIPFNIRTGLLHKINHSNIEIAFSVDDDTRELAAVMFPELTLPDEQNAELRKRMIPHPELKRVTK